MLKEVIFTEPELVERLQYWQEKLRLRDWLVQINIRRDREFTTKDANAEIHYNISNKSAFINIMDPIDFNDWLPQDMDWLIVHELLHLHFAPWDNPENSVAVEQAIESISFGLITLARD